MISLAWVLSVLAGIYVGYKYNRLEQSVKFIYSKIEERQAKRLEKEAETPSEFLDPDDIATQVKLQHRQNLEKLNPDRNFDDL